MHGMLTLYVVVELCNVPWMWSFRWMKSPRQHVPNNGNETEAKWAFFREERSTNRPTASWNHWGSCSNPVQHVKVRGVTVEAKV